MVYKRWQLFAVLLPLFLVETSAFSKLAGWLGWGYDGLLPYTTALAFNALLLGSIVALSLDLPAQMRRNLRVGIVALILCQALANVLLVFEHATAVMPVAVMTRLLPFLDGETALKLTALIEGMALSVISLAFWNVAAQLLHNGFTAARRQKKLIRDVDSLLQEVG